MAGDIYLRGTNIILHSRTAYTTYCINELAGIIKHPFGFQFLGHGAVE